MQKKFAILVPLEFKKRNKNSDDKRIEKIYFKRYQIYTCMFYVSVLDERASIISTK